MIVNKKSSLLQDEIKLPQIFDISGLVEVLTQNMEGFSSHMKGKGKRELLFIIIKFKSVKEKNILVFSSCFTQFVLKVSTHHAQSHHHPQRPAHRSDVWCLHPWALSMVTTVEVTAFQPLMLYPLSAPTQASTAFADGMAT